MKINFNRAKITKTRSREGSVLCICSSTAIRYLPLILLSTSGIWAGVRAAGPGESLVLLCLPGILSALVEELLFRGLVYHSALKLTRSTAFAAILSAVLFGAGHFVSYAGSAARASGDLAVTICQIIYALSAGLMLAELVRTSGSLLPGIVFHCLNNIFQTIGDKEAALALFGGNRIRMRILSAAVLSLAFLIYTACLHFSAENVQ